MGNTWACFEADGKYWIQNIALYNTTRREKVVSGGGFNAQ
jgi:hypothetical protein